MIFLEEPATFSDIYLKMRDMDGIEFDWGKIYNAIGIQKQKEQDRQIRELQEKSRDFNQRLVNLEKYDYIYNFSKKIIEVSEENELQKSEQSMLTNDILKDIEGLYEIENIRDQISYCASIAEKTLKLLKIMKKPDAGNYKKNIIHLFYQAIKRNYAKKKFDEKQVDLLMELMKKSKSSFVGEEEYFEFDERLYLNKFEIFSEQE